MRHPACGRGGSVTISGRSVPSGLHVTTSVAVCVCVCVWECVQGLTVSKANLVPQSCSLELYRCQQLWESTLQPRFLGSMVPSSTCDTQPALAVSMAAFNTHESRHTSVCDSDSIATVWQGRAVVRDARAGCSIVNRRRRGAVGLSRLRGVNERERTREGSGRKLCVIVCVISFSPYT
jgi:hypothetical protein